MAGRDNVIFTAAVASGTSAGTVVPLTLLYGVENVRQGYGIPRLKSVRALFDGMYATGFGIPIDIKNSNWIDSAGVIAQFVDDDTSINRNSLGFMRGRDKVLSPNTSWIINAVLPNNTTSAGNIYVLFEIEYSDVPGINEPDSLDGKGSPVMKTCTNASVTAGANVLIPLGSFDNLLQDTTYILSEASVAIPGGSVSSSANFLVVEGFSNQRGLTRIIPVKNTGLADQIEGSVYMTKQTYNLGLIRSIATSAAAVSVSMEMIASKN